MSAKMHFQYSVFSLSLLSCQSYFNLKTFKLILLYLQDSIILENGKDCGKQYKSQYLLAQMDGILYRLRYMCGLV